MTLWARLTYRARETLSWFAETTVSTYFDLFT